jgi:hypothetical protein
MLEKERKKSESREKPSLLHQVLFSSHHFSVCHSLGEIDSFKFGEGERGRVRERERKR